MQYFGQVKDSTGEDIREGVRVTSRNVEDLKDSKGQCNFQLKFVKDARRSAYLSVIPVKNFTRCMTGNDDRQWVPIVGFDCRGMDVVGFHPEASPADDLITSQVGNAKIRVLRQQAKLTRHS